VEQCFFRVAQEAITNVVKHARAKSLTVKLEVKENKVSLTVQDDGIGFGFDETNATKHFGLLGMKERAEFVDGELSVASRPGAGTIVQLTI
jgi:two-component system sensor histidine kinase DegS